MATDERSDAELLDAWRGGDRNAGNALFQRHFTALYRFFRNKIDDGTDDLIQRTLLACVESRDRFRKQASFRTYLFTIARHELYAHLRGLKRQRERFDPMSSSVAELRGTVSRVLAARAEQRALLHALRQLPVALQLTLELYYWEDMSARELAGVFDVAEGTVRTRLRRAKQLLARALAEQGPAGAALESDAADLDAWARALRATVSQAVEPAP